MRTVLNLTFYVSLSYLALCVFYWSSAPETKKCPTMECFLLEPIGFKG